MKQFKKVVKTIVFSSMLAAGMMLPVGVSAQKDAENGGGLFGFGKLFGSEGKGSLFNEDPAEKGEIDIQGMDNFGIGEEAPLGSGIALLLAAGLGYVALKKKED